MSRRRQAGRPTPADHAAALERLGVWLWGARCWGCAEHPRGAGWYVAHQRQIEAVAARLTPLARWEMGQHLRALGIRLPRPRRPRATKPTKEATS